MKLIIYFVSIINKAQIVDITAFDSSHNIFKIAITKESTEIGTTVTEQHFLKWVYGREGGVGRDKKQPCKIANLRPQFCILPVTLVEKSIA